MDLSLHPLPCRDILTLRVPENYSSTIAAVSILTTEGSTIYQEIHYSKRMIDINTAQLTPNCYLIKLATLDGEIVQQFVKTE